MRRRKEQRKEREQKKREGSREKIDDHWSRCGGHHPAHGGGNTLLWSAPCGASSTIDLKTSWTCSSSTTTITLSAPFQCPRSVPCSAG